MAIFILVAFVMIVVTGCVAISWHVSNGHAGIDYYHRLTELDIEIQKRHQRRKQRLNRWNSVQEMRLNPDCACLLGSDIRWYTEKEARNRPEFKEYFEEVDELLENGPFADNP